jgi:hypothetical protein
MRRRALIVAALVFPAALGAQPATRQPTDGVVLAFERFADIFGSRLVAAFDSIPAARYDYRPTDHSRSRQASAPCFTLPFVPRRAYTSGRSGRSSTNGTTFTTSGKLSRSRGASVST